MHTLLSIVPRPLLALTLVLASCTDSGEVKSDAPTGLPANPQRVVSLAPSATEVLFAVGAGDRVIGVTRYCDYPPEANELPEVGGFLDPNYEMLIALDPDVLALLTVHDDVQPTLKQMGLPYLVFDHERIDGILESIAVAGDVFDEEAGAEALLADLRGRMAAVQERVAGGPRPRVLISAGREYGAGEITSIYAGGPDEWYDTLLTMAGGQNAYDGDVRFPELSVEAVLRMDPEIVLELAPNLEEQGLTPEVVRAEWSTLPQLAAVKEARVHVLTGDYVATPGPRFVQLLEDMALALHPAAYADTEAAAP